MVIAAFCPGIVGLFHWRAGARQPGQVAIDPDDGGGAVRSASGPEAGVWVIAETDDLKTKYRKITHFQIRPTPLAT